MKLQRGFAAQMDSAPRTTDHEAAYDVDVAVVA